MSPPIEPNAWPKLSLALGTSIVIGLYLLANVAYLAVMPVEEIRHSRLVAADVAQRLIGAPGLAGVLTDLNVALVGP